MSLEFVGKYFGEEFVVKYIIDASYWTGPNPSYWQQYFVHFLGVLPIGLLWAIGFQLCYFVVHIVSLKFFPAYRKMNLLKRTDWTSRIIAMIIILMSIYHTIYISIEVSFHDLVPQFDTREVPYEKNSWHLNTHMDLHGLYWIFRFYTLFLGYELYDLKNCIDIKMYSGVIHHLVLILLIPCAWDSSMLAIPGLWVFMNGYISNIPAHIRSFLLNLGYRETAFYRFNKWAWWYSYIICRLFAYPWLCGQIWFKLSAVKSQAPLYAVAYWTACVATHYALSMYWFVQMTKTMFVPDGGVLKKVDSLKILPTPSGDRGNESDGEEGGQKFD